MGYEIFYDVNIIYVSVLLGFPSTRRTTSFGIHETLAALKKQTLETLAKLETLAILETLATLETLAVVTEVNVARETLSDWLKFYANEV